MAARKAQIINTFDGENRSAIIKTPNIRVPMINPNCTEEITWLTMSEPKSNFLVSDSNIAFPANQVEVQANCDRIMMGRI
jgi:hypothetical protein